VVLAHGVVYVHSAPPAICPHVEWALSGVLGERVSLEWTEQSAAPGQLRASSVWSAAPGTAGRIAAALRKWHMLRFEVTEHLWLGLVDGSVPSHLPGEAHGRHASLADGGPDDRLKFVVRCDLRCEVETTMVANVVDRLGEVAITSHLRPGRL
jgi:hypothetical protein